MVDLSLVVCLAAALGDMQDPLFSTDFQEDKESYEWLVALTRCLMFVRYGKVSRKGKKVILC